ncbi:hypothetical protein LWC33_03375 [Pseudonocardia sp. RS11V-5]|uniref:hypothetical protein n=1 Tax=Pseudonocardia terrae TaxID=2905831 RepID=UPI001E3FB4E9|nr:hypothetical protein [Pseudonocardia terrae]MCE3550491.1 hypothetical protein [Pseudonocardia terrae]
MTLATTTQSVIDPSDTLLLHAPRSSDGQNDLDAHPRAILVPPGAVLSLIFNLGALSTSSRCCSCGVSAGHGRGHRLILFGFLPQSSKTKAMAAVMSVTDGRGGGVFDTLGWRGELGRFRLEFYGSLSARADALFELCEAVLCADGPVRCRS